MPNAYFVINGPGLFDVVNPDWQRVAEITVWGQVDQMAQKIIDEGQSRGIPIRYMYEMRAAA